MAQERRFGEREVAEILRTAAELQAEGSYAGSDGVGVSLAEIQRIAGEVGIDPGHVTTAIARFDAEPSKQAFRFWGAPISFIRRKTAAGKMDDAAWEDAVAELRQATGCIGNSTAVGQTREWSGDGGWVGAHLSARARDDSTNLTLTVNQSSSSVVSWMLTFIFDFLSSIFLGVLVHKTSTGPAGFIGGLLVILLSTYFFTNWAVRRRYAKNLGMADGLLERISMLAQSQETPSLTSAPTIGEESPPHLNVRS